MVLAERAKDAKDNPTLTEMLKELKTRLTDAQVELAKVKKTMSEHEKKYVGKLLVREAVKMIEEVEQTTREVTQDAAPLLEGKGETFLVGGQVTLLAKALKENSGGSQDQVFKDMSKGAESIAKKPFCEYVEKIAVELSR